MIGRTSVSLFDPKREEPILLRAGDTVRFVPQKEGYVKHHPRWHVHLSTGRGRHSFRQSGISHCGALDKPALNVANLLVGNDANAAALEITLGQLVVEFEADGWFA